MSVLIEAYFCGTRFSVGALIVSPRSFHQGKHVETSWISVDAEASSQCRFLISDIFHQIDALSAAIVAHYDGDNHFAATLVDSDDQSKAPWSES